MGDRERAPLAALCAKLQQPATSAQRAALAKPVATPASFTQYHTGWMDRQEAALRGWLNEVLAPAAPGGGEGGGGGLASRRLVARLRGMLWQLYARDTELIRCVDVCAGPLPVAAAHRQLRSRGSWARCLQPSVSPHAPLHQRCAQGGAAH